MVQPGVQGGDRVLRASHTVEFKIIYSTGGQNYSDRFGSLPVDVDEAQALDFKSWRGKRCHFT